MIYWCIIQCSKTTNDRSKADDRPSNKKGALPPLLIILMPAEIELLRLATPCLS
jgi:hypothetical protein